uniref:pre-mRNA 3'-end-processing factor FIP1 isoform X1 n=1 Tax=Maylandia zebra TaxID=106582 RepID=UPI0006465DCA|nr:pre-mRNA 3'-end-processing factor FIP1 isoform X1 [Maylandia zebra]
MTISSIPRTIVTELIKENFLCNILTKYLDFHYHNQERQELKGGRSSGRTQHVGGTTNDLLLEKVQGNEEINQKVEFLEKKPWRKAGANISDYFNYGFDEESWNAYCRKQAKLHGMIRKAQKRHTGYEEEEVFCAYSSPGRPSIVAFRDSDPITNLAGGQPESSREDGHQCHNDGGSNTQVVCEMCHYEDSSNTNQLPPPLSKNSFFKFIKKRVPPRPQPPSSTATSVSGNSTSFNSPSASSRRITISPGVIDTTKARECYILQEKHDKDRDRSRAHGQDKENKRSRNREKEGCSSSYYREAQMKHREPRNQGYKYCYDRGSGKKRKSNKDGSRKRSESSSVRSSRSSRDVGGNRDRRHKQKRNRKAKTCRKNKETSK